MKNGRLVSAADRAATALEGEDVTGEYSVPNPALRAEGVPAPPQNSLGAGAGDPVPGRFAFERGGAGGARKKVF